MNHDIDTTYSCVYSIPDQQQNIANKEKEKGERINVTVQILKDLLTRKNLARTLYMLKIAIERLIVLILFKF